MPLRYANHSRDRQWKKVTKNESMVKVAGRVKGILNNSIWKKISNADNVTTRMAKQGIAIKATKASTELRQKDVNEKRRWKDKGERERELQFSWVR